MEEKNTIYKLQAIDLIALYESLRELNYNPDVRDDRLYFYVSRYAMDGIGYHVGYEQYEGYLPIFQKSQFYIAGLPTSIFPDVVFPSTLEIGDIESAVDEEEYNKDLDDDSDGGYYGPDEDFAFSELEYALNEAIKNLPEAEFDKDTKTWSCGYFKMSI